MSVDREFDPSGISAGGSRDGGREPAGGVCAGRTRDQAGRNKPAAPAATTAPAAAAKPTEAPKPAEAAKPTAAPAAAAKPAEAAKPAAPAAASGKPEAKLGAQLIGKIEGAVAQPEAKRPAKLAESPMLAELVKAGKLPPVEQRVPEEPEGPQAAA